MLCNKKLKIFLALACMLVIFYGCGRGDESVGLELLEVQGDRMENALEEVTTQVESPVQTQEEALTKLAVHVCGAVKSPGVYYLSEDSRVIEAVRAAGGFSEDASTDYLNLAAMLSDGEQVYVPTVEEADAGRASEKEASLQLININTAGKEVLMTLPGIGESRALDIISYREREGAFGSVSDIMKVSGIKQSIFDKICDMICVK